jgi:hypothetical protein
MTLTPVCPRIVPFLAAALLLSAAAMTTAAAVEMPIRKAGLWEVKMIEASSKVPGMTMQQCTDETTDKEMTSTFSPMAKEVCSRNDIQKTAAGYVADAVCTVNGIAMTSHSEINGDFNSAYSVKVTSHHEGAPAGAPRDTVMTIEAKWLGPCKPDQKAGDMVMPGGFKMNIKDLQKLKAMVPKK